MVPIRVGGRTDLSLYPDRYSHVWESDYARAFEGAYFARVLTEARQQGRIGKVARDPNLLLSLFLGYWRRWRQG